MKPFNSCLKAFNYLHFTNIYKKYSKKCLTSFICVSIAKVQDSCYLSINKIKVQLFASLRMTKTSNKKIAKTILAYMERDST